MLMVEPQKVDRQASDDVGANVDCYANHNLLPERPSSLIVHGVGIFFISRLASISDSSILKFLHPLG